MKKWALVVLAMLGTALLSGCEWTGGSETTTWDNSANWVDFSGVYRNSGRIMVTQFGTSGGWTNAVGSTNSISQLIGRGNGTTTLFEGRLSQRPLPGSLTFVAGAYVFTDSAGSDSGTAALGVNIHDGTEGTINYASKQYTLRFSYPLDAGAAISASYAYEYIDESDSGSGQGNHGSAIYSFTVYQQGDTLILIDSNGNRYDGKLGSVRVTGGNPPTNPIEESNAILQNGPVSAQFSVTGVVNGYSVTIVGAFQGTRDEERLIGRVMNGTYIEDGGYQADIRGTASNVGVSSD